MPNMWKHEEVKPRMKGGVRSELTLVCLEVKNERGKRMRRNLKVIPLMVLMVTLLAGSVVGAQTIKFGLVAPFTGSGSILGDYIQEAFAYNSWQLFQ